jgi:signal transduction histidine kinase
MDKYFDNSMCLPENNYIHMCKYVYIFLGFVVIISAKNASAQTKHIEGFKKEIVASKSKSDKIKAIFSLCELGHSIHPDTMASYANKAKSLAKEISARPAEVWAMYYQSVIYTTKGEIDSSLALANECLKLVEKYKIDDKLLQANLYNQKGRCFMRKTQFKEAIEMGYLTIRTAELAKNELMQIKGKTLIGWAYLEMNQLKDALYWHLKAKNTTKNQQILEKYAVLFANLALNYNALGKPDSGFFYINKAIAFARHDENLLYLTNSLAIQGQLLVRSGQGEKAELPLKEAVEKRKLIGDPFYIVSDMSQLGIYYANNNQPEKGIKICKEGIEIAEKYKIDTKLLFLYSSLAENYKVINDGQNYAKTLEKIIELKDHVLQKNSVQSISEIQTKYEAEKNEKIIALQKLDLIQKNYWMYGSSIFVILTATIFWLLFKNYRRRQNQKMQMALEEEKRIAAKSIIDAEEQERKRIAADLHDNIGAYATAIRADVEKINDNGIENSAGFLHNLQQHSDEIIGSLRDTIWVLNKENITITSISDRLKNYVNKLQPSYENINIQINEEIENDRKISSQNALNIFRIMQEAIHNSLKHSKANNLLINIISKEYLNISVVDNGIGLNETKIIRGEGLTNMQMRAKEIGLDLSIISDQHNGTTLALNSNNNTVF